MRPLLPLLSCLALSTVGCGELPGERVGTYKITMTLVENTCGATALHLLDGHRYSAELRQDARHGYWRVPSQPPLEGKYDPPRFRFESSGLVATEGPDAGPRGCALRQHDVLTGELSKLPESDAGTDAGEETEDTDDATPDAGDEDSDAGAEKDKETDAGDDVPAISGEHIFNITPVSGTDCRVALTPFGQFEKLPCSVRYTLEGVDTKSF